jgi:hypothetical protein
VSSLKFLFLPDDLLGPSTLDAESGPIWDLVSGRQRGGLKHDPDEGINLETEELES